MHTHTCTKPNRYPIPIHSLPNAEINALICKVLRSLEGVPQSYASIVSYNGTTSPSAFACVLAVIERFDWTWNIDCHYDNTADRVYCFTIRVYKDGKVHAYHSCSNQSYMRAGCIAFLLACGKEFPKEAQNAHVS